LKGGKEYSFSHLPMEWQQIASEIVSMKNRIEFGLVVLDKDLDDKQKLAAEAYQTAIATKSKET
jgi:hypothetical protein